MNLGKDILFTKFFSPLAALLIPAIPLATISFITESFAKKVIPTNFLASLILLFVGLIAIALGNLRKKVHLEFSALIREGILIIVFVYIIASLSKGIFAINAFIPAPINVTAVILASSQWLFTAYIQSVLRNREYFLLEINGKSGIELQNAVRDTQTLSQDSIIGMKRVSRIVNGLAATVLIYWLSIKAYGLNISTLALTFSLLSIILPFIVHLFKIQFIADQYHAGEGLYVDRKLQSQRLVFGAYILIVSCILALALSRNTSLLPLSWIEAFFDWLSSLFKGQDGIYNLDYLSNIQADDSLVALREAMEARETIDLSHIWLFLKIVGLSVTGFFLIWFIIKPLFSKHLYKVFKNFSFISFIKQKFRAFIVLFSRRNKQEYSDPTYDLENLTIVKKRLDSITNSNKNKKKQREIGILVKYFFKLIHWGFEKGKPFLSSMTPYEYVSSLTELPEINKQLCLEIGYSFEEALYSNSSLHPADIRAFIRNIDAIITKKPATHISNTPK